MYVNSRKKIASQTQNATLTPLAYKQKAQKFAKEASQTLDATAADLTNPAKQSQALVQSKKVLGEAKAVVQSNPNKAEAVQQSQKLDLVTKESQAVKATIDQAVVLRRRADDPEKELMPLKVQLLQKMVTGLNSDLPVVRQNARAALAKLGLTSKEMDHLRLTLECQKMQRQQASLQFAGRFPIKLSTPSGTRFAGGWGPGTDDNQGLAELHKCSSWIGSDPLANSILDRVLDNASFNDVANQASTYQVHNVSGHLNQVLFGAGGWVPNGTDGEGRTLYVWSNNV